MEPALQAYKKSADVWQILGSTEGPISVSSHEELEESFAKANLKPGDKVCQPFLLKNLEVYLIYFSTCLSASPLLIDYPPC